MEQMYEQIPVGEYRAPCEVRGLVAKALDEAQAKHGKYFASWHEVYGVLAEEVMEVQTELRILEAAMGHLIHAIHDTDESAISADLYAVCQRAELAASEAVQVAAVVVKALMSKGEWQNRDHPDGRPGTGDAV